MAQNPFAVVKPEAGHGEVHVSLLPPSSIVIQSLRYMYPLKLVTSSPHRVTLPALSDQHHDQSPEIKVPLLFMLSYGGGLLPPDAIHLNVTLEANTRLTLATQGSTKVFPSPDPADSPKTTKTHSGPLVATQTLRVKLGPGAALLLSPDQVQPFRGSHYSQLQIFEVAPSASLCFLDWVSSGRPARSEVWDAGSWRGRNEVWRVTDSSAAPNGAQQGQGSQRRLLLRDAITLSDGPSGLGQSMLKHEQKGVFGTLALLGPLFEDMGSFFMEEFASQPRHGAKKWDDDEEETVSRLHTWREQRLRREELDDVVWTAARVRGLVLVKFTARQVEGAKAWLQDMFTYEGTVGRDFGPGGLMSVR